MAYHVANKWYSSGLSFAPPWGWRNMKSSCAEPGLSFWVLEAGQSNGGNSRWVQSQTTPILRSVLQPWPFAGNKIPVGSDTAYSIKATQRWTNTKLQRFYTRILEASMFHYQHTNLCLQLSSAVSLRSEGDHRGWEPDDDANSDKVRLHSQQLAKIAETKGLNSAAKLEWRHAFIGELVKSRKAGISFVTCLSPSVRTELGSHSKDFHEVLYFNTFRKYVEKIRASLKSAKNNGYFSWRSIYIFDQISLNSSRNRKRFTQSCRNKTHTFYVL
jgi:hypothetical protein